jgi:hypothetical protein
MASVYKTLTADDIASTKTLLHEAIPVTGTIVSGSYSGANIKTFAHGMFKTVYDYPYQSSSANALFDLSIGHSVNSNASASAVSAGTTTYLRKKINIYNQMAKVLVGSDTTGSILKFDEDGNFNNTGDSIDNLFIINFSRLLAKDEIKKGSFELQLGIGTSSAAPFAATMTIKDASGSDNYKVNSPVGEYGVLYATSVSSGSIAQANPSCGLVFYQAGVAIINTNVFAISSSNTVTTSVSSNQRGLLTSAYGIPYMYTTKTVEDAFVSGSIDDVTGYFASRIKNVLINNTTELNSTIYFCKIGNGDFNYSSNATYLSGSRIRVKNSAADAPVSYFTTIGLYSPNNELLAVAKLSEPIKKDPTNELILRVRLDY